MLVSEVRLENIKAIQGEDLKVALDFARPNGSLPRWIVVAGRNGVGKSTFLQALALAVAGPAAARTLRGTFADWIRNGAAAGSAMARLRHSAGDGFAPQSDPWVGLRWTRQSEGPEPALEGVRLDWDPARGPWSENPRGWFLVGYGPFRRLAFAATEGQRLVTAPGRAGNLASLFREDALLSEGILWLREIYLRRLESAPGAEVVEQSVLRLLNDGLLPDGARVTRITSDGLWVRTPAGLELPLLSLSDGYRNVAALVLDIVRQLYSTYGTLDEVAAPAGIAFGHEGVVLIDEIDVHLHAAWQQRIGFWLKEHFPNLQFFVSTHSPFICQAADERGLVLLPGGSGEGPPRILEGEPFNRITNGTADDAVLTDLFGLQTPYSLRASALRREAATLESRVVDDTITEPEKQRLREIRSQLPATQSADVAEAVRQLVLSLDDAQD